MCKMGPIIIFCKMLCSQLIRVTHTSIYNIFPFNRFINFTFATCRSHFPIVASIKPEPFLCFSIFFFFCVPNVHPERSAYWFSLLCRIICVIKICVMRWMHTYLLLYYFVFGSGGCDINFNIRVVWNNFPHASPSMHRQTHSIRIATCDRFEWKWNLWKWIMREKNVFDGFLFFRFRFRFYSFFFLVLCVCQCVVSAKIDWLSYFLAHYYYYASDIYIYIFYRNFMSSIITGIKQTQRTQSNERNRTEQTFILMSSSRYCLVHNAILMFANMCTCRDLSDEYVNMCFVYEDGFLFHFVVLFSSSSVK